MLNSPVPGVKRTFMRKKTRLSRRARTLLLLGLGAVVFVLQMIALAYLAGLFSTLTTVTR